MLVTALIVLVCSPAACNRIASLDPSPEFFKAHLTKIAIPATTGSLTIHSKMGKKYNTIVSGFWLGNQV